MVAEIPEAPAMLVCLSRRPLEGAPKDRQVPAVVIVVRHCQLFATDLWELRWPLELAPEG